MLTDHVRNPTTCNALQLYTRTLEGRIQDCENKWHNHVLRMDFSRLTQKLRLINGRKNTGRPRRQWQNSH